MKYPYQAKLELDKILYILSEYAVTYLGKEAILAIHPSNKKEEVAFMQKQTTEATSLLIRKGNIPLSEIADMTISFKKLESNQILSPRMLLDLANLLKISRILVQYFQADEDFDTSSFPVLSTYFQALYQNIGIENRIFSDILDENTIDDKASSVLSSIRRKKNKLQEQIKEKLNSFIHSSTYASAIMEPVITIRNDRFVIPVKSEARSQIKGFVHDISSSGSTVFMEPISIFELNNEKNNLQIEENIEIEKILKELTKLFEPIQQNLEENIRTITLLDTIFAKAKYGMTMDATEPVLNSQKEINLIQARHPLISKEKVVPINISLGRDFTSLVITGPNTGGKTVTLKTVGLLCLMAYIGLHIPVKEHSSLYVFDHIFADIGDEQSIQESLSTFSSHMLHIVEIIQKATPDSLILLDELGSGTDPIEGAALAISILEYFYKKNCLTLCTTHYSEVKNHCLVTKGFENASCEFDIKSLKPTYRLLIGIPGKSNAFAISQQLGLNSSILANAKSYLSDSHTNIEEVIKQIYDNRIIIEREKEEIEKNRRQIELLRKSLETENTKQHKKEQESIENAKKQAREIILDAKEEATAVIRQLNEIYNNSDMDSIKKANQLRNKLNTSLSQKQFTSSLSTNTSTNTLKEEQVTIGMSVFVTTLNTIGTVLSLPNKAKEVEVSVGNVKMKLPIFSLLPSKEKEKKAVIQTRNQNSFKSKTVNTEINVIGLNVEEAISIIDKYLDDASMAKLETVRIVHGKGTGKLREGIHHYLKKHPHVKSFRIGSFGEGEMGATVVTLK